MKALSIVVSTNLFTYTSNFARNFLPVFIGILVPLLFPMKFADEAANLSAICRGVILELSNKFGIYATWRPCLGHDRKYGGTISKKLHSTLPLVDTKFAQQPTGKS